MSDQTDTSETFDIRNFAQTMREIFMWRVNQLKASGDQPYEALFFQAQNDIANVRKKLERAYKSAGQKRGQTPDLWMFGLAAYHMVIEKQQRIDDVLNASGAKLSRLALELGQPIQEEAAPLLEEWMASGQHPTQAHIWQQPFMFEKKDPS